MMLSSRSFGLLAGLLAIRCAPLVMHDPFPALTISPSPVTLRGSYSKPTRGKGRKRHRSAATIRTNARRKAARRHAA